MRLRNYLELCRLRWRCLRRFRRFFRVCGTLALRIETQVISCPREDVASSPRHAPLLVTIVYPSHRRVYGCDACTFEDVCHQLRSVLSQFNRARLPLVVLRPQKKIKLLSS